jgi:hypothetical protein
MFAFRVLLLACILVPSSRTSRSVPEAPRLPAAVKLEDLRCWVRESTARIECEAAPAGEGFRTPLRLRTWFRYDGVEVFPQLRKGGAEWVWKWRTLAIGAPGRPGRVG